MERIILSLAINDINITGCGLIKGLDTVIYDFRDSRF